MSASFLRTAKSIGGPTVRSLFKVESIEISAHRDASPIETLSTAPTITENDIEPRHLDLRPFVPSGKTTYVSTGGLTRVALRKGSTIVNSSQGGGSKDTLIVDV